MRKRFQLAASLLCLLWSASGFAQQSHIGNLAGSAKRGKELYIRYCIFCHGPQGDGQ